MASIVGYQRISTVGTWRESLNLTMTVPTGTTRVVVLAGYEGSVNSEPATVSIGGTGMTRVCFDQTASGATRNSAYIYEVAFTSTGSQTLAMTQIGSSSAAHDGYVVYLDDYNASEANEAGLHTGTTASRSVTTSTNDALLLGIANWAVSTTITVDSPGTALEASNTNAGFTKVGGYYVKVTAGSTGMDWTSPSNAVRGASALAAFPPVGGGGGGSGGVYYMRRRSTTTGGRGL